MASERVEEIRKQVKTWSRSHRDIAMYLLSEVDKLEIALEEAEEELGVYRAGEYNRSVEGDA